MELSKRHTQTVRIKVVSVMHPSSHTPPASSDIESNSQEVTNDAYMFGMSVDRLRQAPAYVPMYMQSQMYAAPGYSYPVYPYPAYVASPGVPGHGNVVPNAVAAPRPASPDVAPKVAKLYRTESMDNIWEPLAPGKAKPVCFFVFVDCVG